MKIGYVCADPGIPLRGVKGASVHLRSLASALARRGNDLLLLCARTDGTDPQPEGVRVASIPSDASDRWFSEQFADAGTEAVLERYSLQSGAALHAARTRKLPFTLEVNAPLVDEGARFRGLQDVAMWRARERRLLGEADRLIVVSTRLRELALDAGARGTAISVIPNGVELELFWRGGRDMIRRRLGLNGEILIGFVGSLKPWHGVSQLLEAIASLPRSYRLVIVGDGPGRPALEEQASALDIRSRVTFVGAVSHAQVPRYLDAMDIGAAPFESMASFYFSPLKVAEYLAAALPVVASRQGDLPTLVGDAGILYDPGSRDALTSALRRLGEDSMLRATLGRRALARSASFAWGTVAARVEGVLETAVRQAVLS